MKFNLDNLTRESVKRLSPYSTARDDFKGVASIYLDANENPFSNDFNRYPDPKQTNLKEAITLIKQVEQNQIILGNGSDEIIDLLIRAFCEPGIDNVIAPQPTYGMYGVCAAINNVQIRQPLLTTCFDIDLSTIKNSIDGNTKIIFLCSPNNPSGNLLNEEEVKSLFQFFNGLVVIDEAYIDFAETKGFLPFLNQFPNLVILQTFSKAWGLAGIRLGAAYASIDVIQILNKIKPPYNINSISQQVALQTISNQQQKNEQVNIIQHERQLMEQSIKLFSFVKKVFPSQANFLLVRMSNAKECYDVLIREGVIVRDRSSTTLCENCLRITVGSPVENKQLIIALKKYEKSIIY